MNKTHVRSYTITTGGDIKVLDYKDGKQSDISTEYQNVALDRRNLRIDAYLDVFRYDNGDLTWSGSPNGHHVEAARSFQLLLGLFTADASGAAEAPRAL